MTCSAQRLIELLEAFVPSGEVGAINPEPNKGTYNVNSIYGRLVRDDDEMPATVKASRLVPGDLIYLDWRQRKANGPEGQKRIDQPFRVVRLIRPSERDYGSHLGLVLEPISSPGEEFELEDVDGRAFRRAERGRPQPRMPAMGLPTHQSQPTKNSRNLPPAILPAIGTINDLKKTLPDDTLLLVREGDYYILYGLDAKIASTVLGLILTKRDNEHMCGFMVSALSLRLGDLQRTGRPVAIAEPSEKDEDAYEIVKIHPGFT